LLPDVFCCQRCKRRINGPCKTSYARFGRRRSLGSLGRLLGRLLGRRHSLEGRRHNLGRHSLGKLVVCSLIIGLNRSGNKLVAWISRQDRRFCHTRVSIKSLIVRLIGFQNEPHT
jgi:hypothetical protein